MTVTDAEALAVLVVHGLNELRAEACCPQCCAPCSVIQELASRHADGIQPTLEEIIAKAPDEVGTGWSWQGDDGFVDRKWLASRWVLAVRGHQEHQRW